MSNDSKFTANNLPKIWIASYSEASKLLASETGDAIAHIISIGEPGTSPPKGYTKVPHRLRLEFDDIVALNDDFFYVLCTSEHIRQVIDFVPIISQEGGDVLIQTEFAQQYSDSVAAFPVPRTEVVLCPDCIFPLDAENHRPILTGHWDYVEYR